MPYDYGTLFGINTVDPDNSRVNLATLLATGTATANHLRSSVPYLDVDGQVAMYLEDNSTNVEFTYMVSSNFYVYRMIFGNGTGTSSFALAETIAIPSSIVSGNIFGISKVNDSLYYIYYAVVDASSTTPNVDTDIRRCSAIPAGYTDTSLQVVSTPNAAGGNIVVAFDIHERIVYIKTTELPSGLTYREDALYSFDMDSETLTALDTFSLPVAASTTYSNNVSMTVSTNGTVVWYLGYLVLNGTRRIRKIVWNGVTTTVYDLDPSPTVQLVSTNYSHYNFLQTKVVAEFFLVGTDYFAVADSVSLDVTVSTDHTNIPTSNIVPVAFSSLTSYPKVALDTNTNEYYWLDTYGVPSTQILPAGVTTILDVYPTLDTNNTNVYATALMDDASYKLLSINTTSGNIDGQYQIGDFYFPLSTSTYTSVFNHGNFFVGVESTRLKISYLDIAQINTANQVMMIIEQN